MNVVSVASNSSKSRLAVWRKVERKAADWLERERVHRHGLFEEIECSD
jgi:hypothetical protein